MFVVTEAEAAAIRAVYEQRGEFSAAIELRRLFPAVTDTAQARACARTIAGWKPLPVPLRSVSRYARGDAIPPHRPDCGFCHASRRLRWSARRELFRSCDLHDADRDASVMEEVTAPVGCRNVLVVTGSAA